MTKTKTTTIQTQGRRQKTSTSVRFKKATTQGREQKKTIVDRLITRAADGSTTTHEKESSLSVKETQKQEECIQYRTSITQTLELMENGSNDMLLKKSRFGKEMSSIILTELQGFTKNHRSWRTQVRKSMYMAMGTYACVPFVLLTWKEILSARVKISSYDLGRILGYKLVFATMYRSVGDGEYAAIIRKDDKETSLRLDNFDVDSHVGTLRLQVPSSRFNILVRVENMDGFILKTIQCKQSQKLLVSTTQMLAEDTLRHLASII
jgi:hypothetical protein